ncbi:hypothetical protein IM774_10175 [Erysipelotrichaceae bacterium RD49]|nr:hypothetical protein [Erysipelotrichaceae bacterium RD49]
MDFIQPLPARTLLRSFPDSPLQQGGRIDRHPAPCPGMAFLAWSLFEMPYPSTLQLAAILPALFNVQSDLQELAHSCPLDVDLLGQAKIKVEKTIDRLCLNDPFFLSTLITLEPAWLVRMLKVQYGRPDLDFDLASLRSPCFVEVDGQLRLFDFRIDLLDSKTPFYGNFLVLLPWEDPSPFFFEGIYTPSDGYPPFCQADQDWDLHFPFTTHQAIDLLSDARWLDIEEDRYNLMHDWFCQKAEDFYEAGLGKLSQQIKTDDHARQLLLVKWSQWMATDFLQRSSCQ